MRRITRWLPTSYHRTGSADQSSSVSRWQQLRFSSWSSWKASKKRVSDATTAAAPGPLRLRPRGSVSPIAAAAAVMEGKGGVSSSPTTSSTKPTSPTTISSSENSSSQMLKKNKVDVNPKSEASSSFSAESEPYYTILGVKIARTAGVVDELLAPLTFNNQVEGGDSRSSCGEVDPTSRFSTHPLISTLTKARLAEKYSFDRLSMMQRLVLPKILSPSTKSNDSSSSPSSSEGDSMEEEEYSKKSNLAKQEKEPDLLIKAPADTGRTLLMVIAAVELLSRNPGPRYDSIGCIIMCTHGPQAKTVLGHLKGLSVDHKLRVVMMLDGLPGMRTSVEADQNMLLDINENGGRSAAQRCRSVDILITTPGRAVLHLEATPEFTAMLATTRFVMVEEADHLCNLGKKTELIFDCIHASGSRPWGGCRTIGFCATIQENFRLSLSRQMYRPERGGKLLLLKHEGSFLNQQRVTTCKEGSSVTPPLVVDRATGTTSIATANNGDSGTFAGLTSCYLCRVGDQFAVVFDLLQAEIAKNPTSYKILAVCVNTRTTALYTELAKLLGIRGVLESHGRRSRQGKLESNDRFKSAGKDGSGGVILFTSDLRCLEFDMTLGVQIGMHTDWQQWSDVMGSRLLSSKRTTFVFCRDENLYFSRSEKNVLAVQMRNNHKEDKKEGSLAPDRPALVSLPDPYPANTAVQWAMDKVSFELKQIVYQNQLTYWVSCCARFLWTKEMAIEYVNEFAVKGMRFATPPGVHPEVVRDMKIEGVPGVVADPKAVSPKVPTVFSSHLFKAAGVKASEVPRSGEIRKNKKAGPFRF